MQFSKCDSFYLKIQKSRFYIFVDLKNLMKEKALTAIL